MVVAVMVAVWIAAMGMIVTVGATVAVVMAITGLFALPCLVAGCPASAVYVFWVVTVEASRAAACSPYV